MAHHEVRGEATAAGDRLVVGVLRLAGAAAFTVMLSAGYYYNVTFVQLGLTDLGTRVLAMSHERVATIMALLAVVTAAVAVVCGLALWRWRLSSSFIVKLRLACIAIALQTVLTAIAPSLSSERLLVVWVLAAGATLGVAVPATFGLAVDLVPVRWRGAVAAGATALAYFAAPIASGDWTVDPLAWQMVAVMLPATLALAAVAIWGRVWLEPLARQHADPAFGLGRALRPRVDGTDGVPRAVRGGLVVLVVLMFVVFFVDSLGFLRLVETPAYMVHAWQAAELGPRLAISVTHVIAALVAGVLYGALGPRVVLAWTLGIFALVHLMYAVDALAGAGGASLAMPLLYAVAVSLYTVVNFAVWADLSTPETITVNVAVGVALSAWTATFLSTALALRLQAQGVGLVEHFNLVNALALVAFLAVMMVLVWPGGRPRWVRT